jgi:hypothetical protein
LSRGALAAAKTGEDKDGQHSAECVSDCHRNLDYVRLFDWREQRFVIDCH